jgi:prepilin-type N-terminal cleavage/methylation domain-containing protein
MGKIRKLPNNGFTIIELMIATSVFSVILLLCATMLIQISRIYQKGVIRAQTQEVARSVIVNIAESIQFSGGEVYPVIPVNGTEGYCIDGKLVSYLKNWELVDSTPNQTSAAEETRYALVTSKAPGCPDTTTAQNLKAGAVNSSSKELLSPHMRISELTICKPGPYNPAIPDCPNPPPQGSNLYQIKVKISYGDKDLFTPDPATGTCVSNRFGGSFCAISELNTTVQKRILR